MPGCHTRNNDDPLLLTSLGLSLLNLLVHAGATVANPSNIPALTDATLQFVEQFRPSRHAINESQFSSILASRLKKHLEKELYRSKQCGVNQKSLQGAITAVENALKEICEDDDALLHAVWHPDEFSNYFKTRTDGVRRNEIDSSAESFFDALRDAVAHEFTRLAPWSPRFEQTALLEILKRIDGGIGSLHDRHDSTDRDLTELKNIQSQPNKPRRSHRRILFGTGKRPDSVVNLVKRKAEDDVKRQVINEAAPRTALIGMRGSGKTQLATLVAELCEQQGWPLVAWLDASSAESVQSGLADLAQWLEPMPPTPSPRSPEEAAQDCLNSLSSADQANRLIIFDNVEDFKYLSNFVPRGQGLRVLATSPYEQDWEDSGWQHLKIEPFSREESVNYLTNHFEDANQHMANKLAEALGDLPLAITQAVATARDNRYPLARYLDVLNQNPLVTGIQPLGSEYCSAVSSALQLAFRSALNKIDDNKRQLLAKKQLGALSLLATSGVPVQWLDNMDQETIDAHFALTNLLKSSVCHLSNDKTKVIIHSLQSRIIREDDDWKPGTENGRRSHDAAAEILSSVEIGELYAKYKTDALALAEQFRALPTQPYSYPLFSDTRTAEALNRILQCLLNGPSQTALTLEPAVKLSVINLGPTHQASPALQYKLARNYHAAEKYEEAICLFDQILHYEHVLGYENSLNTRIALADAYNSHGRHKKAAELNREIITSLNEKGNPDESTVLQVNNNLAAALLNAQEYDEAIELCQQIIRECSPDRTDLTLNARNTLANAHLGNRDYVEAIRLFEELIPDCERYLTPLHRNTLEARNNCAHAYELNGQRTIAVGLWTKLLPDCVSVLQDAPLTQYIRDRLATTHRETDPREECET